MAFQQLLLLSNLSLFSFSRTFTPTIQQCKPQPGDSDWPSQAEWQALNSSVSGRLIVPTPPGAVCHPSWPEFDKAACKVVTLNWNETQFHYQSPVSVDYNDVTCLPNAQAPCSADGYPQYVITAANANDVQQGVQFAQKTGIRLIVKATGHDYPGRSSGSDSLSIYTRNLRGIEKVKTLRSNAATEPAALVKISAGERFVDIYKFAANNGLTIIGGADPHVGIGGWTSGGGHGPVTAKYGMGADQVVEMDVVTADGELRTISAESEPDLFWAMRGSGGSTYGVIISVTVKAYPTTSISSYYFSYNTTSDTDTFWSLTAFFHSKLPELSKAGLMGYYTVFPLMPGVTNESIKGAVVGQLLGPGLSAEQTSAIMAPLEAVLVNSNWGDPVYNGSITSNYPDFSAFWSKTTTPQAAGFSGRLGSRLLGENALTVDIDALKSALRTSTPASELMLGHLVAGPGTHDPPNGIAGGEDAVGPGWRKAYTLIELPRAWNSTNKTEMKAVTTDLRDVETEALRKLAPNTGTYVNEVDPTEPNWQATLYGDNYPRLLEVKKKWDPLGVFWCKHCAGSELWDAVGPYGIDNGVGQSLVRLCKK